MTSLAWIGFRRRASLWLAATLIAVLAACRSAAPESDRVVDQRGDFVVVALMHTDCRNIASVINDLVYHARTRLPKDGPCVIGPPPGWPPPWPSQAETRVCIALPASNSILIEASPENTPRIVELIAGLDDDHVAQTR